MNLSKVILPIQNDVMVCVGRDVLLWHPSSALVAPMARLSAPAVAICVDATSQRVLLGCGDGTVWLLGSRDLHFPKAPQCVRCVEAEMIFTKKFGG